MARPCSSLQYFCCPGPRRSKRFPGVQLCCVWLLTAIGDNENCLNKKHRILTGPNVRLFPRPKKRPISPFKRGQITSKSNSSDNSIGPWRHVSSSHKPFCFNVYNQKQHLFWKEKGGRKKVVNLFRIFLDPCLNKKKVVDGVDKVL